MSRPTKYEGGPLSRYRSFRLCAEVDNKLIAAARESGRSISGEIESRLERTFIEDRERDERVIRAMHETYSDKPYTTLPPSRRLEG